MKRLERKWMYKRLDENKKMRREFARGVIEFLDLAKKDENFKSSGELRCPCAKCKNCVYLNEMDLKSHLALRGFCGLYYNWTCHGEPFDGVLPKRIEDPKFSEVSSKPKVDATPSKLMEKTKKKNNDEWITPKAVEFTEKVRQKEAQKVTGDVAPHMLPCSYSSSSQSSQSSYTPTSLARTTSQNAELRSKPGQLTQAHEDIMNELSELQRQLEEERRENDEVRRRTQQMLEQIKAELGIVVHTLDCNPSPGPRRDDFGHDISGGSSKDHGDIPPV